MDCESMMKISEDLGNETNITFNLKTEVQIYEHEFSETTEPYAEYCQIKEETLQEILVTNLGNGTQNVEHLQTEPHFNTLLSGNGSLVNMEKGNNYEIQILERNLNEIEKRIMEDDVPLDTFLSSLDNCYNRHIETVFVDSGEYLQNVEKNLIENKVSPDEKFSGFPENYGFGHIDKVISDWTQSVEKHVIENEVSLDKFYTFLENCDDKHIEIVVEQKVSLNEFFSDTPGSYDKSDIIGEKYVEAKIETINYNNLESDISEGRNSTKLVPFTENTSTDCKIPKVVFRQKLQILLLRENLEEKRKRLMRKRMFTSSAISPQVPNRDQSPANYFHCEPKFSKKKFQNAVEEKTTPRQNKHDHDEKVYQCDDCSYKTNRRKNIIRHVNIHSKVRLYKCDNCPYTSKCREYMSTHAKSHERNPIMFKCPECDHQTKHKYSLRNHLLTHRRMDEVHLFECSECPYKTKYLNALKSHTVVHKKYKDIDFYVCSHCGWQTKYKPNLRRHMKCHKDAMITKCPYPGCDFQTIHRPNLKRHVERHQNINNSKHFKCELCNFVTRYNESLLRHKLIHKKGDRVELFECAHCNFKNKSKDYLRLHIRSKHQKLNTFSCNLCDYKCFFNPSFKRHMITHHKLSNPYKCHQCKYITYARDLFRLHVKKHESNKKLTKESMEM